MVVYRFGLQMPRSHSRLFICASLVLLAPCFVTAAASSVVSEERESLVKPFFAQHCTSCHGEKKQKGDLLVGRWRTVETIKDGKGDNPTLDPSGVLPDTDKFAATVTEKLATYALRRGMTFTDREELKRVAAEAKKNDYHLVSLIEALVTSPLFLKR